MYLRLISPDTEEGDKKNDKLEREK